MISFKGILKYLIYFFVAAWMFLLGIVVGRGTSPVTFDTKKFQERLEYIAKAHDKENEKVPERVDLGFFGSLKHPIPTEGSKGARKTEEIIPKKEVPVPKVQETGVLMKLSRKTLTDTRHLIEKKPEQLPQKLVSGDTATKNRVKMPVQTSEKQEPKTAEKPEPEEKTVQDKGLYTIQIAAYKDFKDAVTQMAQLEKKGFASYREKTIIDGIVWYRIRTGSFSTLAQARQFSERLKKAKIDTLIIKRD